MSKQRIQSVFFDAVGTLIHPEPSAAEVYTDVGKRFGSRLELPAIRSGFRRAFARQENLDRQSGWRTSEGREMERWRAIVGEVLRDVNEPERCFQALYHHFSQPAHWRLDNAAGELIAKLASEGHIVGMASNFDRRLRSVAAGFPVLAKVKHLVISSEAGWRKPAREFFDVVCRTAGAAAAEILFVGDDLDNDFRGAIAAGLNAAMIDDVLARGGSLEDFCDLRGGEQG
jgi:putative hydrolase of the HAD superfamily